MSAKEIIMKEAYMEYRRNAPKPQTVELAAIVDEETKAIHLFVGYKPKERLL